MVDLATHRQSVFSAPNTMFIDWEGGSGRLIPREALDWRHSG
jgi:hypothetical protein